jgi:hypothetical protein
MVNPSLIRQLAREYRREDLAAGQAHGLALRLWHHPIREWVGWALVGLGVCLTKDPSLGALGAMGQDRHASGALGAGAPRPGAPRARNSVPLARL